MPISKITYEVSGDAKQRRIVYTGSVQDGYPITYGPVITTDKAYDPAAEIPAIEVLMNEALVEREIGQWVQDPSKPPLFKEATKERYYAVVAEQEKVVLEQVALEQAKADAVKAAKDQVKPTVIEKIVAYFTGT